MHALKTIYDCFPQTFFILGMVLRSPLLETRMVLDKKLGTCRQALLELQEEYVIYASKAKLANDFPDSTRLDVYGARISELLSAVDMFHLNYLFTKILYLNLPFHFGIVMDNLELAGNHLAFLDTVWLQVVHCVQMLDEAWSGLSDSEVTPHQQLPQPTLDLQLGRRVFGLSEMGALSRPLQKPR